MDDGEVEDFLKGMGEPKYRAKQVRQRTIIYMLSFLIRQTFLTRYSRYVPGEVCARKEYTLVPGAMSWEASSTAFQWHDAQTATVW